MNKYYKYIVIMVIVMLLIDALFWTVGIINLNKDSDVASVFARTFISLGIAMAVMTIVAAIAVPISLNKAQKAHNINYAEINANQLKMLNNQIEIITLQIRDIQRQLNEELLPTAKEYTSIVEANKQVENLNLQYQELQIKLLKSRENQQ